MASAATPAIAALVAAGVPHQVLRFHHDPRAESFGAEAADELAVTAGVQSEQVFKTLVVAVPKGLAVAVLPVPLKLSLKAAAAALGVPKAAMAERAAAERSTGYVIGGSRRSASAGRWRRSSTPPRWSGTGCSAAQASAAGTCRWRQGSRSPDRRGDRRHPCAVGEGMR